MLAGIAAGAGFAWAVAPFLFTQLPNDRQRVGVVLKAVREDPPRLAIIGNSVAMYGLDARRFGADARNLATPAQSLAESVILFDALPPATTDVVLLLTPWHLAATETLDAQAWNAWWMWGARPTPAARAIVTRTGGMEVAQILATPDAVQRFRSRWAVRSAIETVARDLLRPDPARAIDTADLFRPARDSGDVPREDAWSGSAGQPFRVDGGQRRMVVSLARLASQRGKRLTIVLAPLSPKLRTWFGSHSIAAIRSTRFAGTRTIDATLLLPDATDFVDATHPNAEGAARLSTFVAARAGASR